VPEAVLKWTAVTTQLENSAPLDLETIMDLIIKAHMAGKKVVRLHSGDPSLFGAIAEQLRILDQNHISYEIIPGVTAAFGAAAALKIEYTLPEISQTLILTRLQGRTPVPEREHLAALAAHRSSMAIYLSAGMAEKLAEILADAYGAHAPVAVVYKASHEDEKILWTEINNLAQSMKDAAITRQALVIVGDVLESQRKNKFAPSRLYDKNFSHGYRASQRSEVRGQRAEGRGQRSEVRGRKSEDRGLRAEKNSRDG
jgi:precorrin-4/cobalt-precorrin-4 C11-methyltransferase